jgi:hypothetical protein
VQADITGSVNWTNSNNWDFGTNTAIDPFSSYHDYQLIGVAEVIPLSVDGQQAGDIGRITLDNDTLSGSFQFDPIVDPDIYYVLHLSLLLETRVGNVDPFFGIIGDLPDELEIGTSSNPLDMTASVSQVPIPSSVILLLSGIGGLVTIRRRFSGARKRS